MSNLKLQFYQEDLKECTDIFLLTLALNKLNQKLKKI